MIVRITYDKNENKALDLVLYCILISKCDYDCLTVILNDNKRILLSFYEFSLQQFPFASKYKNNDLNFYY